MLWRGAIVAGILGLWLTIGVAWGGRAAFVYGFFVLVACVFGFWAIAAGHLSRRAGAGYYHRQLDPQRSGRWRDRVAHRR